MRKFGQALMSYGKKAILPDFATLCYCFLLLTLIWSAAFWQIDQDRKNTLAAVAHENEKFCRAFDEQVRRIFYTNEHYLGMIKQEFEKTYSVTPAIHQLLSELAHDSVFIQVGVYSAQGEVLASRFKPPANINVADLPHVRAHLAADSGQVYIGKPFVGRISKQLSIHMSKRLNSSDGSFAGVAVVAVDPAYFTRFYHTMDFNDNYVVRVIGLDGVVRASNTASEIGIDASNTNLFARLAQQPAGFYRSSGKVFGRKVLTNYFRMTNYPFVLQVGVDERALTPLTQRRNGYLIAASGVSIFVLVSSLILIRSSRRLRRSETQLQVSFDELTSAHEEITATEEELRSQYDSLLQINEHASRQNTILSLLQETTFIVVNKLDMDQLLKTIVRQAALMAGAEDAFIVLPSADHQYLEVKAGIGIYGEGNFDKAPIGSGLMGKVFASGRTEVVEDYQNWQGRMDYPMADTIQSLLAAPLYAKSQIAGVFGVALRQSGGRFDDDQMRMLACFAELASLALENASMHQNVQEELNRRIQLTEELSQMQAERQAVMDAIPDAMIIMDHSGRLISVRRPHEDFGPFVDDRDLAGLCIAETLPNDIADDCKAYISQAIETGVSCGREFTVLMGGDARYWDVRFSKIGPDKVLVMIRDITVVRRSQEQVEFLSLHDPLTSLYNRTYFEDMMEKLPQQDCGVAIVVCDVDGLKLINDTLGHSAGDNLLRVVAATLREAVHGVEGKVARIGGDEFAVILNKPEKLKIEETVERIRYLIEVYNADNQNLPVSLSIGWAADYVSCRHADEVFKQADNAMYRQKMHQSQSMRSSIVETMMKALEARDYITEGHADRLGDYAEKMGLLLDLPEGRLADLRLLAKFHDIGKVGIPDHILNKPGKLSDEELAVMRGHCEIGCRIALASPDLSPIADWILKHQEWWDGSGYPLGIQKDQIPIECRILALADAYDAMTNDRPYRKALSSETALLEITRFSGTQFDPELAILFIEMIKGQFR